ncbi:hypothetical protein HCC61_19040 [Streptomyces sp. HNM0575]|uniref:hypothetical protein n=1 Tax=Streptomyces sp. HNM0575 TaxID=2716338 RepID=UPI00145DC376|nr:hypothetical protein [Streptomyces sp. HNM0575]NLU74747.1 hypothetical protein [Streptomyces sp. HNM0575]
MRAGAFLYPWDVVGDPEAAPRLASLGVRQATLASAYHSVRALTPRHPGRRVVTARHSAVLYPPDAERWSGRALRPYEQGWIDCEDPGGPYGEAARALSEAGIEVHSWVVLAHNSRLGEEHAHITVRNAYGDRYAWAPCVARPEVREYLVALAGEAAVRPYTSGTELESCGWYGLAHLHAHDKTGGARLDGAAQYLMSLCFCEVCVAGYAGLGADPEELRARVKGALEPVWSGAAPRTGAGTGLEAADADRTREGEWLRVAGLLGADAAAVCASWRAEAARRLRREAVAAVRTAAAARASAGTAGVRTATAPAAGPDFRVMLHADPAPHRLGANAGVAPAQAVEDADGVVVPCGGGAAERAEALGPFAEAAEAAEAAGVAGAAGARAAEESGPGAGRVPGREAGDGSGSGSGSGTGTGIRGRFTVAANFTVVSGMGGSPHTLAADAAHARDLGAAELRLYHAGLAPDADLAAVGQALRELASPHTAG